MVDGNHKQVETLVYTVSEVCKVTRLGRTKVYQMAQNGEIPVKRCGRKLLFPCKLIHKWLEITQDGGHTDGY